MLNDDYILRSDAIRVIEYYEPNYTKEDEIHIAAMTIRINQIPAADVEPKRKTGRWIDLDDHLLCSSCGASHTDPDKNYCSNCGANMTGE